MATEDSSSSSGTSTSMALWLTVGVEAVCDLGQEKDVSICNSDDAIVFLSDTQLRALQIRAGSAVWARPTAAAVAATESSAASPAVPILVHVLTERMRSITHVARPPTPSATDDTLVGAVATPALRAQFATDGTAAAAGAAPLSVYFSLQLCLPPMVAPSLPQAQHVVLRAHLQHRHSRSGRHRPGRSRAVPLAFLHSFEFAQLLPSLLQGRVVARGSRLYSDLLSCTHQLDYFEVVEVAQQRAAAPSASGADQTAPVALLLTSQTVLSLQPTTITSPSPLSLHPGASPPSARPFSLPAAFPASPSHWVRRVETRVYGYRSIVHDWVHTVWHNVRQYAEEVEQARRYQQDSAGAVPASAAAGPVSLSAYAPHTFLLHGLHGTGKTHLARTLAGCSGLPYYFVETSTLFQRTEGASEAALVALFAAARAHQAAGRPCIVVLDQLDTILPKPPTDSSTAARDGDDDGGAGLREDSGTGWRMGNSRIEWRLCGVLKELLQEINGLPIPLGGPSAASYASSSPSASLPLPPLFVLLTTSSPESLDAAGMRMSPFVDQEMELRALTREERVEALRLGMKSFVFEEEMRAVAQDPATAAAAAASNGADPSCDRRAAMRQRIFERIASELHGFVGADMSGLIRETLLAAMERTHGGARRRAEAERVIRSAAASAFAAASASTAASSPSAPPSIEVRIARRDYERVIEWMQPANLQQLEFRLPQAATLLTAGSGDDDDDGGDDADAATNPTLDGAASLESDEAQTSPLPFSSLARHFSSLGGITPLLHHLHYSFLLPIKQPHLYANVWRPRLAMAASKGVLLYGRSGCGKSALATCLARACGLNCMVVPATSLVGKVVGSSEKTLASIFARARASAPSLLVFDQVEQLAPIRKGLVRPGGAGGGDDDADEGHDADAYERILSVLLIEMDGVLSSSPSAPQVYVLATSTRPDQIDPALLRPGRLDSHVHLPPPTQESRAEILELVAWDTPLLVQVDAEGRVIVPAQFSLAWSLLPQHMQDRIVQWDWSRPCDPPSEHGDSAAASAADATSPSPSPPELKSFFLHLLSHATSRFTGADLVSLIRESAMASLRRSLDARFVRTWDDLSRGVLRHLRPGVAVEEQEYHPFGANSAGGDKFGGGWTTATAAAAATAGAESGSFPSSSSSSGHAGSAKLFSKKRAEEIVQRNLNIDATAATATVASRHTAPVDPSSTFVASASAAPFVFDSDSGGAAPAPFVFDGGVSFVPSTAPFTFGAGPDPDATGGSGSAAGGFSFSMGSADAPPPTKQEKKEGADRQSIKSSRPS